MSHSSHKKSKYHSKQKHNHPHYVRTSSDNKKHVQQQSPKKTTNHVQQLSAPTDHRYEQPELNDDYNVTHFRSYYGYESWTTYTRKGNIKNYWDNTGYVEAYTYYKNGIVICQTSEGEYIKKRIDRNRYSTVSRLVFRIYTEDVLSN